MLTGKQKQYLKSMANQIPATVQIGKDGLTPAVIDSVRAVLTARELIKIRINKNSEDDVLETAETLSRMMACEVAQVIGSTAVLFKKKKKNSHYELP